MFTKSYGQTGKDVSVIGFGGMRFDPAEDIDTNAELVVYAHGKGINYFDTAPGYDGGDSERTFGAAFKQMDRSTFFVSTKSNRSDGGELRADLEASMERMGVDCVDFFHIWWVVTLDAWRSRVDGGAVAEALRLKEEGLIKHLVLSSHLPGDDLGAVMQEAPFEGVLLGYCAINFPFRESAVRLAGKRNLGVVTMNPLGGGIIPQNADRLDWLRGPDDPSVVAAALRFNISDPAVTSALVGFTTKEHVDEACDAMIDFTPYSPEHIGRVRQSVKEKFGGLCTGCGYCMPCPNKVEVPKLMDTYNQFLLRDDPTILADRLKWHWTLDPENILQCSQCGLCEERCTQHLPITERFTELYDLVKKNPPKF